jgi:hypothetical protein
MVFHEEASMLDDAQQTRWPILIQDLVQHYTVLWHESDTGLPWLGPSYTSGAQRSNERHLDRFLAIVSAELKSAPQTGSQQAMWTRIGLAFRNVARTALDADERALETLLGCGFFEATREFVQMARRFDPAITSKDIYQAGRNVWTANVLQLLLGIPVRVTPAIFAYSMLYPYSDNYLDDPAIPKATKLAFNARFRTRLAGEPLAPRDQHEQIISDLVGLIEGQFDRAQYPQVFESLLAIHRAQGKSLQQMRPSPAPQQIDVLGISFEKGGTSVLADGYLVAGSLSAEQRKCIFGFGLLTQLMDDLEDLPHNLADQFLTIFSQAAQQGLLDGVTNRTLQLCSRILGQLDGLGAADLGPFKDLMTSSIKLFLIDSASRSARLYPRPYLQELETHSPFGFAALHQRRKQLARQKISLPWLIGLLAAPAAADRQVHNQR